MRPLEDGKWVKLLGMALDATELISLASFALNELRADVSDVQLLRVTIAAIF